MTSRHQRHLEAIAAFIEKFWLAPKSPKIWHQALAESRWNRLDWPEAYGGPGWSKPETRLWIDAAAQAGCPLPDERFTVMAPLILALCPAQEKPAILETLATHLESFELNLTGATRIAKDGALAPQPTTDSAALALADDGTARIAKDGALAPKPATNLALVLADDGADGQLLLQVGARTLPLGQGAAPTHLAIHQSPALNLWEAKLTARLTQPLLPDADSPIKARHTLNQISLQTLEAMYLANAKTQNLLATHLRESQTTLLKEALGYYALIQADPHLTSNEPLPHPAQRQHLAWLQTRTPRDLHLQKDALFANALASPIPP